MRILILASSIFFIFSAFLVSFNTTITNPFLAFSFFQLHILFQNLPLILIGFIFIFILFLRKYHSKNNLSPSVLLHSIFHILTGVFIGAFIAFVILIIIALIELNIFSVLLNNNPDIIGVKTDTKEIYEAIKTNNKPPEIITTNKDSKRKVIAIAKATSGINNFYGSKILDGIPEIFILPSNNKDSNLLFLDNTLVVSGVDVNDMQKISPLIGYLLVKNYFSLRQIKSFPKVNVMDKKAYLEFRKKDAEGKVKKIDIELEKMEGFISSVSANIESDKEELSNSTLEKENILKQRNKEYNDCLSEGAYKNKVFVPKNTKEFCQKIIDEWEEKFISQENIEKDLTNKIESDQKKLKEYEFYNNYFKAQKKIK